MQLGFRILSSLALGVLALTGCGGDASAGAADAGPEVGDSGAGRDTGAASSDLTAYQWETLTMSAPAGDSGAVLGALFTDALRKREIVVILRLPKTGDGTLEVGSAARAEGAETPDDPADDVYAFEDAGTCNLADGTTTPCDFAAYAGQMTRDAAGWRTSTPGFVYVYHTVYKMVIRMRSVTLTQRDGDCAADLCGAFSGAVTEADAALTIFDAVTGNPATRTDLKAFMAQFNTAPDTMVADDSGALVPAYTFSGNFDGFEVGFRSP